MWNELHRKLLTWKPIHLCWWFEKHNRPIPKYFIGGGGDPPSVTTVAASNIHKVSAQLNGNITSDGGKGIDSRGFVYSLTSVNSDPDIGEGGVTQIVEGGTTTGTYNSTPTGLTPNTQYSFKAYAINSKGTSYGSALTFTTYALASTVLNTPADTATGQSTTPTLEFTGTDTESLEVEYNVQLDTVDTFDSQTAVMDSYTEANYSTEGSFTATGIGDYGQVFTGNGGAITSAKFYMRHAGTPSGTMVAKIYASDGNVPTGSALATSDSVNATVLTGSHALVEFTFSTPYTTTTGGTYAVLVRLSNPTTDFYIGLDNTSPPYNNAFRGEEASWTGSGWEVIFYVYGTAPLIDADSTTDSGFSNTTDGADTHPFDDADKADYDVQAGDELDNSTTYYWRARAKDPTGSDTWGSWATTRSFTTEAGVVNHTILSQDTSLALTEDNTTITQNHVIASNDIAFTLTEDVGSIDAYPLLTGTYEDKATLPTTDSALANTMTVAEKAKVGLNDDVFFDLEGGDYLIKNFLWDHDNNTDEITVTARVKSTLAPTSSTVYLQIYNYNTPAWETLQSNNTTAADTEFVLTGSKTASLSNYYTTGDKVLARVYQQVV